MKYAEMIDILTGVKHYSISEAQKIALKLKRENAKNHKKPSELVKTLAYYPAWEEVN